VVRDSAVLGAFFEVCEDLTTGRGCMASRRAWRAWMRALRSSGSSVWVGVWAVIGLAGGGLGGSMIALTSASVLERELVG